MKKFLYDFLPLILFFIVYKLYGFYAATVAAIVISLVQVIGVFLIHRKLDKLQLVTLALILVMGGATIAFHDPRFLQWKLTVLNWVIALIFLGSHIIGKKPIMQRALEKNVNLPKRVFVRLNLMWVVYFTGMGLLNLYVMYHFSLNAWVNFKLFGTMGVTIVFIIIQTVYLYRHLKKSL